MNPNQLPEGQRQRCEVWTRVMGYHRPVAAFNAGKQSGASRTPPFPRDAMSATLRVGAWCP